MFTSSLQCTRKPHPYRCPPPTSQVRPFDTALDQENPQLGDEHMIFDGAELN